MSFACKQHTVALRPARAAVVVPCPRHVTARFGQSSSEFEPKVRRVRRARARGAALGCLGPRLEVVRS